MELYIISNESHSEIYAREFKNHRDAITWCQNTQDMSQLWFVDSARFLVWNLYGKS